MEKKLYIHIGTPKTGSSFIQSVFNKKGTVLNEHGIIYPGIENLNYISNSNTDINGQLLTRIFRLSNKDDIFEHRNDVMSILSDLFSLGSNKVFISDESLIVMPPIIWKLILSCCKDLDIKTVFFGYYRKPSTYYPSHWAQVVRKHGEHNSLIDFTNKNNLPIWRNLLELYKQADEMYIFSYENERKTNGLLYSSALVLDIPSEVFHQDTTTNKVVNESLSLQALTSIRLVNAEYGEDIGKKVDTLLTTSNKINNFNKPALPEDLINMVEDRHKQEIIDCIQAYEQSLVNLDAKL